MNRQVISFLLFFSMLFWAACAEKRPKYSLPQTPQEREAAQLSNAVEAFYKAETPEAMKAAVEKAEAISAPSALYHEIARQVALLEDRPIDAFEHALSALLDPANDQPSLALIFIQSAHWNHEMRLMAEGLFDTLMREHPDPVIRTQAAYYALKAAQRKNDMETVETLRERLGFAVDFAIIGTWDNEQGKGFDIPCPPESEIRMDKRYQGQLVDVGWRTNPKRRLYGEIDFEQLFWPNSWAVGYAVSAIDAQEKGDYILRLSTSDPVKVWVNGRLIFSERRIQHFRYDAIPIPITLQKGANRILIKTAQETGPWLLSARITKPNGIAASEEQLRALNPETPITTIGKARNKPLDLESIVESRYLTNNISNARKLYLKGFWAYLFGLNTLAIRSLEALVKDDEESITANMLLMRCLWNNQERSRTSDLLEKLGKKAGAAFVDIELRRAEFKRQNNLSRKAREILVKARENHPDSPNAHLALADYFSGESWRIDSLRILKQMDKKWPNFPYIEQELAQAYKYLGYYEKAERHYRDILANIPNDYATLQNMYYLENGRKNFDSALHWANRFIEAYPQKLSGYLRRGEMYRKMEAYAPAIESFQHIVRQAPTNPSGYAKLAHLYYLQKQDAKALEYWNAELERNPKNAQLANRIDYLAPPLKGVWAKDVPTEEAIENAIARRERVAFNPAANFALLLDHRVTSAKPDGSYTSVNTEVRHILNKTGRDHSTHYSLPGSGRVRVLHAYSVDKEGKMREASSIRGRSIRFRQLEIGATIVVQYRQDAPPSRYLSRYFASRWYFQGYQTQFVESAYILWTPKETTVHEFMRGDVAREESEKEGMRRIRWHRMETPVLLMEPFMPPITDTGSLITVSTVPSWDIFKAWEAALLTDVFEATPAIVELSKTLFEGAKTKLEKLYRIQEFLMSEIRYQMDYERVIAGVKPHSAAMVLARRYGDCKDKSVLFITLAKLADIKARFTLVKTRQAGMVFQETPMQQFNHAIVFVEPQKGLPELPEGRFFDPTTDALDVESLRPDDQNTMAFLFNLEESSYEWKRIPYQTPQENYERQDIRLTLDAEGNATGVVSVKAKGLSGRALRIQSRNPENFQKNLQQKFARVFEGAHLSNIVEENTKDVMKPAAISIDLEAPAFAREENNALRFKIPLERRLGMIFTMAERSLPMVLGVPTGFSMKMEIRAPKGRTIQSHPKDTLIQTDCITFSRETTAKGDTLRSHLRLELTCGEIAAEDYPKQREAVDKIREALAEEVVLR